MSATDELRKMLDERGVEHKDVWPMTLWGRHTYGSVDYYHYVVHEIEGQLCMQMHDVTPEQAIEATLGRGECEDIGTDRFVCSKCGCTLDIEDAASCEPTMWVDGVAACPRFCPNCGRKVKQ